ncbi:hypothetical protein NDU88_005110 [Pleurodeles waltl]|uniref:Uncharacterized protein n=1 Tax=Pleurodeles waltl TaxID=8319 RepID=A0AAV7SKW1_PLEWA|nr:hypothetical protein NDU88_005110 [Pleurodeles waltl]
MSSSMAERKVQEALRLLEEAGRLDLLQEGVGGPSRPPRRASGGVAAAVLACSTSRDVGGRQAGRGCAGGRRVVRPGPEGSGRLACSRLAERRVSVARSCMLTASRRGHKEKGRGLQAALGARPPGRASLPAGPGRGGVCHHRGYGKQVPGGGRPSR